MMKAFTFYVFIFVGTSILVSMMAGGGGMSSTQLNGGITSTDLAIVVDSNSGFAPSGIIYIDNERIYYNSLTGTTQFDIPAGGRGYGGTTTAVAHLDNAVVRTEDNAAVNNIFGFDIGQLFDKWGLFAFPVVAYNFFTKTIPLMMQGNISQLFMGNGLGILVSFWMVLASGFIFMLIIVLINARRQ